MKYWRHLQPECATNTRSTYEILPRPQVTEKGGVSRHDQRIRHPRNLVAGNRRARRADRQLKPSADQPYTDFVGTQSPYVTSSGAGTPQWRGNWQNSVDYGPYSLTATTYYVSGYKAVGFDQFGTMDCNGGSTYGGSDPNFNCHVRRFIDVDLVGSVRVNDKFTFYMNVINLTDEKAPLNAGNYAATNYNPTYTQIGAVGRTFRFGANFRF